MILGSLEEMQAEKKHQRGLRKQQATVKEYKQKRSYLVEAELSYHDQDYLGCFWGRQTASAAKQFGNQLRSHILSSVHCSGYWDTRLVISVVVAGDKGCSRPSAIENILRNSLSSPL
ncbi:hypothetical protein TNCV_3529781 [Trichonephila clavipes]|uniref:Uncharacterized protein n=1 Tax=Trichonephila clavipes TaxID=2585209 RepID=A0A8X6RGF9_TRICX|nr:hypothetical protein TNCV_3529781 [Trichonephila clavipes]